MKPATSPAAPTQASRSPLSVALLAAAAAVVFVSPAFTQRSPHASRGIEIVDGHEAAAGEVIARFAGGYPADLTALVDASAAVPLPRRAAYHVRSRSKGTAELLAILAPRGDVLYVEPNYLIRATVLPDDPLFSAQWFLENPSIARSSIQVAAAWDITTGSRAHVVGLVDTGIDHTHPDLVDNLWTAPSAYTLNIDGGSLTCPAGAHGFDAYAASCSPFDGNGHGTGMAGVIGATGNNGLGTAGINWQTSIMDLRFLGPDGTGFVSDAIKAIDAGLQLKQMFGAAADVRVLSNSWTVTGLSQALSDELANTSSADVLVVAAAGNYSEDDDTTPRSPASLSTSNLITVAATTEADSLSSYSNWGATTVDVGAPGDNIQTTWAGGTYVLVTGTSPAAAIVSGIAALVLSACDLDTPALKDTILRSVDAVPALAGMTVTGGRVNAATAVRQCAGGNQAPFVTVSSPADQSIFTAPATITITADASDADGFVTRVDFYANGAFLASDTTAPYSIVSSNVAAGTYELSAIAIDNQGATAASASVHVTVGPAPAWQPPGRGYALHAPPRPSPRHSPPPPAPGPPWARLQ